MRLAILKNELDENHLNWAKACDSRRISFDVIDMLGYQWIEELMKGNYNGCLACPPGRETLYKQMYDEKINIVANELGLYVYPDYRAITIHENKKYLSYWLSVNKLPYPSTNTFYHLKEAIEFAENCKLPIVGKFNIGASGKGVEIIRDRDKLINYINSAFSDGLRQNWGPNLKMGQFAHRLLRVINNPLIIKNRIEVYRKVYNEIQKGYVILQEYIPHEFEWRIVKIGKFYFGHQKVKMGDKASGTKGIDFVPPPSKLLDFVEQICTLNKFETMAIDLFEDGKGGYLINEMQCIFGHVQAYICEKDGEPGRFRRIEEDWVFEPGLFNSNLSYDLRLDNVLEILARP